MKYTQITRFIRSFNKHPPNREWAVEVLAIWAPDDPIFERSYKYVKPKTDYDLFLDNEDGFFDDMPKLPEKYIRKTNRLRMPKKVRQDLELKKIRDFQNRLMERESELVDALAYPDTDSAYGSESDGDKYDEGRGRTKHGEEEEKEASGSENYEFKGD